MWCISSKTILNSSKKILNLTLHAPFRAFSTLSELLSSKPASMMND